MFSSQNTDYIGFAANFPNQVFKRCIKNGFEFSLMVVGQSGLGKSTFLNTLFMAELHDLEQNNIIESKSTVNIESKTFRLVENDVRLKVTVVDTPGFGDFVDNSKCLEPIVKYIDNRFADYLAEETKIDRSPKIEDKRIHLCFYFIPPNGPGLKQLDIACMQELQNRVNLIPLIAKSDTLTKSELGRFKQQIMDDMRNNNIYCYKFPELNYEELKSVGGSTISVQLEKRLPFAIVGSTHIKEILVGGEATKQKVRVREYPWGTVDVDNLAHNDFVALRDMVFRNNLFHLLEMTKSVHYENYRMRNLSQNSFDDDPFSQAEEEILARQLEASDTRRKQEALFNEEIAIREQRLIERALAMDKEEKKNRKLLDDKQAMLDKLRQEIADTKKKATIICENLPPELPTTTSAKPAKIPRLNSSTVPLPIIICKGIPQQDLDISFSFFTTKPSSRLGLVLHKAEVEGRDYQQRILPKQEQTINPVNTTNCSMIDKFVRNQDELAVKWQERNQDREIREDLTRKIQERDKQILDRKMGIEEKENRKAKKEKRLNKKRKTCTSITPELTTTTAAKTAKIPRLNSSTVPSPIILCKGIPQQPLVDISPSFFTTKPSSRLGLVLHKSEVEGRDYQQRILPKQEQTINPINTTNCSIIDKLFHEQDEIELKWQKRNQDRELREDLTRKIQERDKQILDRKESSKKF